MTRTGAELFVDILEQYGVTHVFGNPGTTELPVVHAVGDSSLEYVLGLHEDIAVGMAGGFASTRRYHAHRDEDPIGEGDFLPLGVANLHLNAGLAHGLGNLYATQVAGAPVLVTAGNHSLDFRHEEPVLSSDLVEMAEPFTKWSAEVLSVDALATMVRRAVKTALTPPTGPVFLALPLDQMLEATDVEPERLGAIPTAGRGDSRQVDRAVEMIADAHDVTMVVGDGIARSGRDGVTAAVEFAEQAGARVQGEILASEIDFPTNHDQWVSYIPPDADMAYTLMSADVLLFVGCSTNTTLVRRDGELVPEDATMIHIGDDPWQLGKNQPADATIIGDPGTVLEELAARLEKAVPEQTRQQRIETIAAQKEFVSAQIRQMGEDEAPDDPRASKAELVDAMYEVAAEAYIVDEGVTAKYALLTRWPFEAEHLLANKGGGLGYGLPAAVGAAIAEAMVDDPRDVVGFVGDGSYLYYPQSIYTAAREAVDLTVVIPDNRNYRILKDNTLKVMGGEESDYDFVGMDFDPPVDLVANANSHGARAELVERADGIADAIADALERPGPDLVDVLVHD